MGRQRRLCLLSISIHVEPTVQKVAQKKKYYAHNAESLIKSTKETTEPGYTTSKPKEQTETA